MKKYMNLKRILSLLLAVVLLAGTVSAFGYGYAKASQSEYNEVTLTLNVEDSSPTGLYLGATITDGPDKGKTIKDVYGDWTSAASAAVLCDGEDKYVSFSSAGVCLYLNANPSIDTYANIVIPKGLVVPMADTSTGALKTPIKINSRVKLVNNGGRWSQEQEPEENYAEIAFDNMAGNTLYLKGTLVEGPNAGEMIGGQTEGYGDWGLNTTATIYVDGTTPLEVFFGTASDLLYIQGINGAVLDNYTSIDIKKDTVLTPASGNICMVPLVIKNDLSLEKKNGKWQVKQDATEGPEGPEEPEVVTDVAINGYEMYPNEGAGFCQLILKTSSNLNTLYPYGVFNGEMTIGDTKKSVEWNIEDNIIYTTGITYQEYLQVAKLSIAKDSIFTMNTDAKKKLKFTNSLELIEKSGVWYDSSATVHDYEINDFEHYAVTDNNYHLLLLKFTKDIRETTNASMKGIIYIDDKAKEVEWYVDPDNGNFYTVGIGLEEGNKLKTVEIKKDTIFTFIGDTKNVLRMTKNFTIENADGTWKVKSDAAEPEVITDVKISRYEMYPKENEGYCQIILFTDKNLNTLYPNGTFMGEITIGNTKKTVEWYAGDNLLYTVGITYQEYLDIDKITIEKDSRFTLLTNDKKVVKFTNGLKLVKKSEQWMEDEVKVHSYEIKDFEHYAVTDNNYHLLLLKFTKDIRKTTTLSMKGIIYLDGKEKDVEWYVDPDNGNFYTVGIGLEEGNKVKTIEIKKDTIFTIIGDNDNVISMSNGLIIENVDGIWKVKSDAAEPEVVTDVKLTSYEMYPKQDEGFCQVILHTNKNLNTLYPNGTFMGEITIGKTKKTVEWYVGDNLLYTVGITYQEYMKADKLEVTKGSKFKLLTNDKKVVKFTNGLKLEKKSGLWINTDAKVHKYEVSGFEIYREAKKNYYQLILRIDGDIRKTTTMPLTGTVYLDGKAKEVEWYIDEKNGLVYTVGITLEEGDKAKKIEIASDSFFTILNDTRNVINIPTAFKITKLDGIWVEDEGQTKIEYNEVKLTYSSSDAKGFYLKAEIVAGPDKGKTIGSKDVYGDWLTSAAGTMTYNKDKTMDVWFSTTGEFLYVSGDYDLAKIKNITFKKGTVLTPMVGAKYSVMMKLANTLDLAKDTRYDRWVLAKDVNKTYKFNDVTLGVTRVTGSVLEMKGSFKKNSKVLKDVYGDWVLLNGAITLGDPIKGKYTDDGATWSLAGDMLMLYGISAGLMDSIQIKAGTILWPDASCKSQDPIRITNDVMMTRNAEDEWVISKGAYVAANTNASAGTTDDTSTSEKTDTKEETTVIANEKETTVRLVEQGSNTKELVSSSIAVETQDNQIVIYIVIGAACVVLGALAILWIVIVKRRKAKNKREDG